MPTAINCGPSFSSLPSLPSLLPRRNRTQSTMQPVAHQSRPVIMAGAVRFRRRRFLGDYVHAIASLRGTALVIVKARDPSVTLAAIDVRSVQLVGRTVRIFAYTARRALVLRISEMKNEWVRVLKQVSADSPPVLGDFRIVSPIGKGGGGEVFLAKEKKTGDGASLAVKVVQKHDAFYSDGSLRHALDERLVLELMRGFPFVVQLKHAFQTDSALYMVTEFCTGGNLKTLLDKQKHSRLPEGAARKIMAQILLALEYLHSRNVLYRDLKPDNILLGANGDIRLCDFGLSKVIPNGAVCRTESYCGSNAYMSPQIVSRNPYGMETDLWSLGALYYRILVGHAPFAPRLGICADRDDMHRRIRKDEAKIPHFISEEGREMLKGLLEKDEGRRLGVEGLKGCGFFRGTDWEGVLEDGRTSIGLGDCKEEECRELRNFDAEARRLRYKGVAIVDKKVESGSLGRLNFSKRGEGQGEYRQKRSISIIGFGYSHLSDFSLIDTDSSNDTAEIF